MAATECNLQVKLVLTVYLEKMLETNQVNLNKDPILADKEPLKKTKWKTKKLRQKFITKKHLIGTDIRECKCQWELLKFNEKATRRSTKTSKKQWLINRFWKQVEIWQEKVIITNQCYRCFYIEIKSINGA